MPEPLVPPFSSRNRGAAPLIDNDFPNTARVGLLHLLQTLVDNRFVDDWTPLALELQRIARIPPGGETAAVILMESLAWDKVLDFCERLYGHLAKDVTRYNGQTEYLEVATPRSEVQEFIARELQLLFLEERLAFEFSEGRVHRRGRRNTQDKIERADLVLGDSRLTAARRHFNKALGFFRNVSVPDYENAIKEAVCAVEAAARVLFPAGGSTLGSVVKSITGNGSGQIPKAIADTFHGVYGFRNGGEGVGHGGATGGPATKELAEYALAVGACQIVFLADLSAASEPDVPF